MTCETHALYRFYGATGQLLYVGITNNPGYRFQQHQQEKPWWHEVSGISVERYESRADALSAERRAIEVESPQYNIQRPQMRNRKAHRQARRERYELAWTCEECKQPIADGAGYLHVDLSEVSDAEAAWEEFERSREARSSWEPVSMDALLELPGRVPWVASHEECDPFGEHHYCYWFSIERARTHAQLLNWSAHLMSKRWLKYTDWPDLINRAAGVDA